MTRIVADIETDSKASKIWCLVTQDLDTKEVKVWQETSEELKEYLSKAEVIIGHNFINFDAPILNRLWNTKIRLSQVFDTLILSRLLNPVIENGHSLDSWGERLGLNKIDYSAIWSWMTGVFVDKKTNTSMPFDEPVESLLLHYCKRDVELTGKLYEHLRQEQSKTKTSEEALQLEFSVQAIIAEQERNGFKLDTPYAMSLLSTIKGEMDEIVGRMREVFPDIVHKRVSEKTGKALQDRVEVFNVGSRKQIAERLIGLGWTPTKFTEKGSVIVDETVLEGVNIPEAKVIARYLMLQKRASMLESWLEKVGRDGRVHGKVITIGAVTGRCTHSDPNMAQVPAVRAEYGKEFRSCWVVDQGNVLVGTDLAGIELRCFAHYLNDSDYTNEVVNGDVHTRNQHAFGVDSRDLAKTILYATLYGASAGKVGRIIGKGEKDGKQIIDNFCKAVPAYKRLKEKVEKIAEKGSIPGLDGRRLQIRSPHAALNTLLQSAGAIIAKKWMVLARANLRKAKVPYKQVAFVHDELQIEVNETFADQVGAIMVASAAQAGVELGFRCPVGAEYKVGRNWAECH
jgi:DNA polymerase I-like protein with 3'-5' exonuclease and polymerase domains